MQNIILKPFIFIISIALSKSILALPQDYTTVTKSYVTNQTNGVTAHGAGTGVTADTTYDVTCYIGQARDLQGSILVTFNNQQNTLDIEHPSFTQLNIPAVMNDAGLYGFIESINGTQIQGMGPYLVTCNLNVKDNK